MNIDLDDVLEVYLRDLDPLYGATLDEKVDHIVRSFLIHKRERST